MRRTTCLTALVLALSPALPAAELPLVADGFSRPDSLTVGNGWDEVAEAAPEEVRIEGGRLLLDIAHPYVKGDSFTGIFRTLPFAASPWTLEARVTLLGIQDPNNAVVLALWRDDGTAFLLSGRAQTGWLARASGLPTIRLADFTEGAAYDLAITSRPEGGQERITFTVNGQAVSGLVAASGEALSIGLLAASNQFSTVAAADGLRFRAEVPPSGVLEDLLAQVSALPSSLRPRQAMRGQLQGCLASVRRAEGLAAAGMHRRAGLAYGNALRRLRAFRHLFAAAGSAAGPEASGRILETEGLAERILAAERLEERAEARAP